MQVQFLVTDGGPHPSDKWAGITAKAIADLIQVDPNSDSPQAKAARLAKPRFELDLADQLEAHHFMVQQAERAALGTGPDRLRTPCDPLEHHGNEIAEAVVRIVEIAATTPFAEHFKTEHVQNVVCGIIGSHFASAMDVERSWFADRRPGCAVSQAYRSARAAHGGGAAHSFIDRHMAK
jgi:hypothetical protein